MKVAKKLPLLDPNIGRTIMSDIVALLMKPNHTVGMYMDGKEESGQL